MHHIGAVDADNSVCVFLMGTSFYYIYNNQAKRVISLSSSLLFVDNSRGLVGASLMQEYLYASLLAAEGIT